MDEMNVKAVETTENKEIRPKIIAVDFDGCLVTNKSRVSIWTRSMQTCRRSSRPLAGTAGRSLPMSIGMTGRC